jgi:hypothetical protein
MFNIWFSFTTADCGFQAAVPKTMIHNVMYMQV